MSLKPSIASAKRQKLLYGLGASVLVFLITLGIFASNGWLPKTDPNTGKKTGWFGKELPANASSTWNPFAAPLPSATPSLSKEYLYAGGRLLAVEDANAGASPSPTPHGLEGDVAPRTLGDSTFLATDTTQERRFVSGLDTPDPATNEFQRADMAPLSTLGNCSIDSSDVVQVRRYVSGLDAPRAAGGPTEQCGSRSPTETEGKETASSNAATPSNRGVRIGPGTGSRGQTVTLPVFMKMDRDEMAVAFTLEYDSTRLSNPRIEMNTQLPASSVLTTNTTQPGKIGLLIDAEQPLSSTPRELRIVFVTFDVRSNALTGSTPINITSSLAIKSVSDGQARLLVTNYTGGAISVIQ